MLARHSSRRVTVGVLQLALVGVVLVAAACAEESTDLGGDSPGSSLSFVDPDASPMPEAGFTLYCPSDECPSGHTTCPSSRFPCDVDLRTDRNNCGGCGVVCPSKTLRETYECIDGACALQCNAAPPAYDCDGVVDNGCETQPNDENCGGCGIACTDPAKPCIDRLFNDIGCGCYEDEIYCTKPFQRCLDPTMDDANCGACENACDPTGGGAPSYPNTYYGCNESKCGALKCVQYTGDCDSDILGDGCETSLLSNDNCGACGRACPAGQECKINAFTTLPECMCPEGKGFCGGCLAPGFCIGACFDFTSDHDNCGGCAKICSHGFPYGREACVYGMCERICELGHADCNGNVIDGCEIDTQTDPRNCGDCGNVCDAIAGQACVGGRCVVEPCDTADAGGLAR